MNSVLIDNIWNKELDNGVFSFIDNKLLEPYNLCLYPTNLIGFDYWDKLYNYDKLAESIYNYPAKIVEQKFPKVLADLIMSYIRYPVIKAVDKFSRVGLVLSTEQGCLCIFQRYTGRNTLCYASCGINELFHDCVLREEDEENLIKLLKGGSYKVGETTIKLT